MRSHRLALLLALPIALAAAPEAQPHTPPASLSQSEMHGLMMGQGMGLAKAAEMQAYPGPKHVLELADSLALSDTQRQTAEALMAGVQAEARPLGARIVEAEQEVSALFAGEAVDDHALEAAIYEAARLRGALRLVHLRAHVAMHDALTPEQSARYHALRHGDDAASGEHAGDHSTHQ